MDYKIDSIKEKGFVLIKVYKSITADLEQSFAKEAVETAQRDDLLNYCADVRGIPNVASTLDNYSMAYENMASYGLKHESKIAILHSINDHSHNFIETVFRNAGYNCKLFTNESDAHDWLKSECASSA
ncbi:MAG: hypothetical protein D8M62_11610 [Proteobacteria bacterium]|nr:hypothetical protein [Pseudomonadota bacterium]